MSEIKRKELCGYTHNDNETALLALPENQGGPGRKACAGCAYEKGRKDATSEMRDRFIRAMVFIRAMGYE